jgi:hypothetical protein
MTPRQIKTFANDFMAGGALDMRTRSAKYDIYAHAYGRMA